jgi:hypothetical protein
LDQWPNIPLHAIGEELGHRSLEEIMKYMLAYTVRTAGLSFDQNFAGSQSLLSAFSKWKPEQEKSLTIHAFVANLAGRGGYVLVEASDPKIITAFVSK